MFGEQAPIVPAPLHRAAPAPILRAAFLSVPTGISPTGISPAGISIGAAISPAGISIGAVLPAVAGEVR